ncbi:hypothetical protein HN446_04775 [bacterium]|jgi:hypothetical protein|nr:hypothetical protein [bacterium]
MNKIKLFSVLLLFQFTVSLAQEAPAIDYTNINVKQTISVTKIYNKLVKWAEEKKIGSVFLKAAVATTAKVIIETALGR